MTAALRSTDLPLPVVRRGKVRDVYAVGDDRVLLVATEPAVVTSLSPAAAIKAKLLPSGLVNSTV